MALPPFYMMELHRVAASKKKMIPRIEKGRPHFLLKWRPDVIDFSRSVRNKNAKSVQSFQEEPYSPKETHSSFFLELTVELAASDYPATIRGNPGACVSSFATINQQGQSRSYYNVGNI